MSAHNVKLRVVLSDASRIIKANRGHFLALSLLFVLPLSLFTIGYPSLSKPTPISSLFTTAPINRSIVNGFFGEPLKFTSLLKFVIVWSFPLTVTYIVSRVILGLIFFAVACFAGLMYGGILLVGGETDFRDVYFLGFVVLLVVLIPGVMIYFQLEWYLADVIAVVESKWGYEPLRRRSDLFKGMTRAFSIFVLYSLLLGIVSSLSQIYCVSVGWMLDLQTVAVTGLGTILRLYGVARTAVLFIYCKALSGQSTSELDPLYVRFLYDGDDKVHKEVV